MTLEELHIEKLPAVPQVLVELLRLCHRPDVEFDDLARVIEQEPALCAKILQVANSSYYRQWAEVHHLRRLLVVLGLDTVRQIAVTSAVHQFFKSFSAKEDSFVTAIWNRSLLCAEIARDLARLTGYGAAEEAYIAGLLHRLGQLVLLQNFPEKYQDILFMDDADAVIEQVERALFEVSYGDVGALLVRRWGLHPFMADALRCQNLPAVALGDGSSLVKLLNLANRLTRSLVRGMADELSLDDALFGLHATLLAEVFTRAQARVAESAGLFGIAGDAAGDRFAPPAVDAEPPARQQLAVYVQAAALIGSGRAGRRRGVDLAQALKGLGCDLELLFGLREVAFLLGDEDGRRLTGVVDDRRPALRELSIALEDSTSLAAQALRTQELRCTLETAEPAAVSLFDEQLRHLLGSEGLLYIPLAAAATAPAVVAAGISRALWQRLEPQRLLLELFARPLASHLAAVRGELDRLSAPLDGEQAWRQLELRKLVHEVNNPLAIIGNYLHVLALKLGGDHPAGAEIALIKEEIVRVGELLARLKDLDAAPAADGELHLNRTVRELFRLFAGSLFASRGIETQLQLDETIPPLRCGAAAVKQVLMNLVKNAVEALPAGGTLRVTSRDRVYKNDALYVELEIADDGPGLPEAVLANLFKPVTSTKKDHSGLGLTIVKNLLDRLGAEIACTTSAAGTRFQILLPRISETDSAHG